MTYRKQYAFKSKLKRINTEGHDIKHNFNSMYKQGWNEVSKDTFPSKLWFELWCMYQNIAFS